MVAMLAFGGTFAYFTAKSNAIEAKTITMAHVTLTKDSAKAVLTMSTSTKALPGDSLSLSAEVENSSNRKVYIFVQVLTTNQSTIALDLTGTVTGWTAADVTNYENVYYTTTEAAEKVTWTKEAILTESTNSVSDNGTIGGNMDKTITINVVFAATQYAQTTTSDGTETAFDVTTAFNLVSSNFTPNTKS